MTPERYTIPWNHLDLSTLSKTIRDEADAEFHKVVSDLDLDLSACDRATCPDHGEHIAWASRKEVIARDLIHGWAWRRSMEDAAEVDALAARVRVLEDFVREYLRTPVNRWKNLDAQALDEKARALLAGEKS